MFRNALHYAMANIRSNRQVCLASIGSIAVALSFPGIFLFIYLNLNSFLSDWNREVQLMVYLKDDINAEQKAKIETVLNGRAGVESIAFISRDEAWANFQHLFSEQSGLLQELEFNPLPASYSVHFVEGPERIDYIRDAALALNGVAGVESVDYGEQWISGFETFLIFLRIFLFALGGILAIGVLLIVSNTIKLSVYSRRDEIELMLLIGAKPRFIKMPFFIEGIFHGALGAVISIGLLKLLHFYFQYQFKEGVAARGAGLEFHFISGLYLALIVAASVLVGWLGSSLSVNQFLKSYKK